MRTDHFDQKGEGDYDERDDWCYDGIKCGLQLQEHDHFIAIVIKQ